MLTLHCVKERVMPRHITAKARLLSSIWWPLFRLKQWYCSPVWDCFGGLSLILQNIQNQLLLYYIILLVNKKFKWLSFTGKIAMEDFWASSWDAILLTIIQVAPKIWIAYIYLLYCHKRISGMALWFAQTIARNFFCNLRINVVANSCTLPVS